MKNKIGSFLSKIWCKIDIIVIIMCFFILLLKTVISDYISPIVTLIPSIILPIWFIIILLKKRIKFEKHDIFFVLMLIIGTISGLINNQRIIAIVYQIKSLSVYYLLYMVIRSIDIDKNKIKSILNVFNVSTIVLIVFAIVEVISSKTLLFPSSWAKEIVYADNFIRAYSLICNPNVFAFYLIFMLLFNYSYNQNKFDVKNTVLYTLLFVGIILSISRSAMLCVGILGAIYFVYLLFHYLKKQKIENKLPFKLILLSLSLAAVISVCTYKINDYYKENIIKSENINQSINENINEGNKNQNENKENNIIYNDESFFGRITDMLNISFLNNSMNNGRLAILKYGFNCLEKNILIGTGFSSFLTASNFLNPDLEAKELGLEYADNQYIAILVETGVLGFFALAAALLSFLISAYKRKDYLSIMATFVLCFFGLFINCLEVQLITFMYFLFIALNDKNQIMGVNE